MDYVVWQIEKMRKAFKDYLAASRKNGKKLSGLELEQAIGRNEKVRAMYRLRFDAAKQKAKAQELNGGKKFKMKIEGPPQQETIRRFLLGIEKGSEQHNLQAIATFLIDRGALREAEITGEPDELKEILTVTSYMANRHDEAVSALDDLPETWAFEESSKNEDGILELNIARDKGTNFFYAEEIVTIKRAGQRPVRSANRGYGFFIENSKKLHIVIKDKCAGDFTFYTEMDGKEHGGRKVAVRSKPVLNSERGGMLRHCVFYLNNKFQQPWVWPTYRASFGRVMEPSTGQFIYNTVMNSDEKGLDDYLNRQEPAPSKGDINYRGALGRTPLMVAALRGSEPCVDLLVKTGSCNYLAQDDLGNYSSDLAFFPGRNFALFERLLELEVEEAEAQGVKLEYNEDIKIDDFS